MAVTRFLAGVAISLAATAAALPQPEGMRKPLAVFGRDEDTNLTERQTSGRHNKLFGRNFPDPAIWTNPKTLDLTFMATQGNGFRIQRAHALKNEWTNADWEYDNVEVLSQPGAWALHDFWAPDFGQLPDFDNTFYMYYTAAIQSGEHCLGLARSGRAIGPYTDGSTTSFICPTAQGGAIDPLGYLNTDGRRYILYKIDGNYKAGRCNLPASTPIMLQELQHDGYHLIGSPVKLLDNLGAADEYNVEAPSLCIRDGIYYLFFSSHCFTGQNYDVSYVTSRNGIRGPYGNRRTLFKTGPTKYGTVVSPGGADVTFDCSRLVFHAAINGGRGLFGADISASNGVVTEL